MVRVLGLPVTDADNAVSQAPRADHMRNQLGGRAPTPESAGALVELQTSEWVNLCGVLLGEQGDQRLILTRGGVVRTADKARVQPLRQGDSELSELAERVRRFAALHEGDPVRVDDARLGPIEGILVEKCRFGGLVLRRDGSLLAAGFSKLEPHAGEQTS